MAARLMPKATTQPTASTANLVPVITEPPTTNLTTLSRDAPAHNGDGEEEGELGHAGTGQAQQQAAHDGGTGAGGAGNDGQHLPHADDEASR